MDATGNITPATIENMTNDAEFGGFGYLGHSDRTERTDARLATAANRLGLTTADVFLWANSRYARHAMDQMGRTATIAQMTDALTNDRRGLPALRKEIAR